MKKVVASVHKKQTQVCSNKQALSNIVKGLQTIAESQTKRMKLSLEADEKMEERECQFRKEESERNRQHELHIKFMQERLPVLSDLQILVITFQP